MLIHGETSFAWSCHASGRFVHALGERGWAAAACSHRILQGLGLTLYFDASWSA